LQDFELIDASNQVIETKPSFLRRIWRDHLDPRKLEADPILLCLAIIFFLGMLIAELLVAFDRKSTVASIIMWPAIFAGLLISMIQIERAVEPVAKLGSSKLLWSGLLACIAYFSHGEAAGKVNEIFGVDSSSLPHATALATVLFLFKPVGYILGIFGLFKLALSIIGPAENKPARVLISLSVALSSLFAAAILSVSSSDKIQTSLIFQFGVHYDFNTRSNCNNLADGDGVLFIGPLQDRAIVVHQAGKIPGWEIPFTIHKIPDKYDWTTCSGPITPPRKPSS